MKRTALFFIIILLAFKSFSQFSMDAQIRPRAEMRNGYKEMPTDSSVAAKLITQRSRIGFNYKKGKILARIAIQDVRTWGDQKYKTNLPSSSMHEAWLEYFITDSLSVKLGRSELIYDNQRLLSNTDWVQAANVHDAAILKFRYSGWKFHLIQAWNQVGDPIYDTYYWSTNVSDFYKHLSVLWVNKKLGNFDISLVSISDGFQKKSVKNSTYYRTTSGMNLIYKANNFEAIARGYYQMGTDTSRNEISAFYANSEIIYKISAKSKLTLGCEVFSGKDAKDTSENKIRAFHTLYGTGHAFNGYMDIFTNIPKHTKNSGLVNPYLKYNFNPTEKLQLFVDLHYFALENNYLNAEGLAIDKYLATELDLTFKYKVSKELSVMGGYSTMFVSSSYVLLRGGDKNVPGHWAWLAVNFTPTLFSSEN